MSEEETERRIRRLMRESVPGQPDPDEPAKQALFLKEAHIDCGPQERESLIKLSFAGNGFSLSRLRKLKNLDHLIWDQDRGRHFIRMLGKREAVVAGVLLLFICVCLWFMALAINEGWWGRASLTHYVWTSASALTAFGCLALLYNLLWIPLHDALAVKRALADMHDTAGRDGE